MATAATKIFFLGKRDDALCAEAVELVTEKFAGAEIRLARRGDPWPRNIDGWQGDYIVSYLSPFIVSERLLKKARLAAINFHPGPPEYPGIGCTNFALYNGETEYGVTCHYMAPRVDTGRIIAVRRFPILSDDTVLTLTQRCYTQILSLFREIVHVIAAGRPLPESDEAWARKPYKRRELDALCHITPDMPADEVTRRIRAVTFPGAPGAYVEVHGYRFDYCRDASNRGGKKA